MDTPWGGRTPRIRSAFTAYWLKVRRAAISPAKSSVVIVVFVLKALPREERSTRMRAHRTYVEVHEAQDSGSNLLRPDRVSAGSLGALHWVLLRSEKSHAWPRLYFEAREKEFSTKTRHDVQCPAAERIAYLHEQANQPLIDARFGASAPRMRARV